MTTTTNEIPLYMLHLSLREDAGRLLTNLAFEAHASLSDVVEALVTAAAEVESDRDYETSIQTVRAYVAEKAKAEAAEMPETLKAAGVRLSKGAA